MKVTGFAKSLVAVNCAVPVFLLAWDAAQDRLGANPVNFAIRTTGLLSLIFLMLSLAISPVSRLAGWSWLGTFRRMLGLYAFAHTGIHFLIFFSLDREANIGSTLSEIAMRTYLLVGVLALILMVPLAVTSTNGMIKTLGPKRWKLLHRLAYLIAIGGVLHFAMLVKADLDRPIVFAAILGVLFAYRLIAHYLQLRADSYRLRMVAPVAVSTVRPKFWTGELRVARIFDEAPGVRTFRLVATDGGRLPFDFLPGQYLNLSFTVDGQKVNRSYTIASSPTRIGSCEITVKREEKGLSSRHLHDAIREGSTIRISAPAGKFTFTGSEAESIVMIAAGVGITPLMSKIRYLTDIGWPGKIDLLFSVKTANDIIFREELLLLQKRFPNLQVTVALTRDPGAQGPWQSGRITAEMVRRAVPQIAMSRVHFCGPSEMTGPMREMLVELGVPETAFFHESFTSPARKTSQDSPIAEQAVPDADAMLTFQRSGKTVAASPTKTVLELAEENGIRIDYDCRSGICGQCKTKLVEGRVAMETQDALDPIDRSNQLILSCQARCLDAVVVDA